MSEKRIPALDGLRGIAVLMVMAYHFCWPFAPTGIVSTAWMNLVRAGWFGVDVFFVLSGFLITGILLDTKDAPHYFRTFYGRRVVRIFPLYYGVVVLIIAAGYLLHGAVGDMARGSVREQGWLWSYLANWKQAAAHDRFATGVFATHFWSLAIEEQFYLVWPFAIWLTPGRHVRTVCLMVAIGSVGLRGILSVMGVDAIVSYAATVTRLDGLAIGAWLAAALRDGYPIERIQRPTTLVALCGFPLVLFGERFVPGLTITFASAVVTILTAALIEYAVEKPAANILASRFLVTLGAYSYGLYVFHYPIRRLFLILLGWEPRSIQGAVGSSVLASISMLLLGGTTSFVVAYASWHLFEKRFLALKRYIPRASTQNHGTALARTAA